jgi:hypothetical protein
MTQAKVHSHRQNKKIELPLQTRLASLELGSADDRTFNVVFTTGAKVRRYDYYNDEAYDEELSVDPVAMRMGRLNSGAPVLDTHGQYALDDVIGVVVPGSARVENGVGRATLKIDSGAENESVVRKIKDGIIKNVSVGYRVHQYEVIRSEGAPPLYRAVDWEPHEISLVPIGADAGAGIRSNPHTFPCEIFQPHPQPNLKENTMPDTDINKDPNPPANAAAAASAATATRAADNAKPETPENDPGGDKKPDAPEDAEGERAEGVKLERARVLEIQKIVHAASLPETDAIRMINSGTSLKKARKEVLNELAKRSAEGGEIRSQVTITRDEMDTCRSLAENALLHRYKPGDYKLEDGARQFRGMSLLEIGRDLLERRGMRTRGMARAEVAGCMLGMETRGGYNTTSDFPNILANVANKTLRAAYEAAPQTFKPFSRQVGLVDFKPVNRTQLGDAPSLEVVNESGEFKRGSVSDAKEQYQLATYGKVVAVTRQAIINDDLSAFTRLPEMFGRAAADLESDTIWGIINSNPNMGDGNALFSTAHGNLAGSGAAITVSTLGASRAAMRQQKGLNGRFINIMAKYLIVPSALETIGEQYVTQTNIIYTKNSDYNPFANKLQVLAEPRLDANSTISWYIAADPSQIDTIEYAYLDGAEGVYLENRIGFDVDGVELKARMDFAAKAIDWRGFYKNPGA